MKNSNSHSDPKLAKKVNGKPIKVSGKPIQPETNHRSNTVYVSDDRSKFTTVGNVEPGVHRALTNGLASILTAMSVTSNFARGPDTSSPSIDQLAEASTSSATRRSILREKDFSTLTHRRDVNRFSKIKQFWSKYPAKETKKSIIFVDQRLSDSSLESVVTLIGTSKPLPKSVLRNSGSLRSATSSSVRFSLPPEALRHEDNALMKIGNWEIICDFGNQDVNEVSTSTWRTFRHTRIFKIVMFLTFALVVPSFLVVPVLIYEDSSKGATV